MNEEKIYALKDSNKKIVNVVFLIVILYISLFLIATILGIFAYQNKNLIEPWIESFRKFGQFGDSEKMIDNKNPPNEILINKQKQSTIVNLGTDDFILELSPLEQNSSLENNQSLFRARVVEIK